MLRVAVPNKGQLAEPARSMLTEAGCDWQIHAYGHTGHAFTDESVHMPEKGLAYSADADRRSFRAIAGWLG